MSRQRRLVSGRTFAVMACAITGGHDREERLLSNIIFSVAAILFLATFTLGLLVQFKVVDTKPFRWLHHALFFAVFVSAAVAVAVGFWFNAPYRWVMLPVLGLFAVLPRVRAGTIGHAALASGALILYSAAFVSIFQEAR
ncbi:MAG: hypothetical protein M3475_07755 [Actinomycetota bacterium]|nr:hypothetical protein [Actinomycetota bacterium]